MRITIMVGAESNRQDMVKSNPKGGLLFPFKSHLPFPVVRPPVPVCGSHAQGDRQWGTSKNFSIAEFSIIQYNERKRMLGKGLYCEKNRKIFCGGNISGRPAHGNDGVQWK